MPDDQRAKLLLELLNVRSDHPLRVVLKEFRQTGDQRFQHIFSITNGTDETVIVSSLIDWLKDADAGTTGHHVLLCTPKSTLELKLEFRLPEVTIKLKGYHLPYGVREAVVSQYEGH